MKSPREDEVRIATEAAQWQHALRAAGAKERAQFVDWVRASPRHLQEFLYMEALEAATDGVDPERRFDIANLAAEASENLVMLEGAPSTFSWEKSRRRAFYRKRWVPAVAAGIAIAVLAGWFTSYRANTYETEIGEQRSVELADGSIVDLNATSRLEVRLSEKAREIELLRGEAMFKVSHDPSRPFIVHAGSTVIRALGTQFNVSRRASGTSVAVIEGKVAVGKVTLNTGEEVCVAPDGSVTLEAQDISEMSAWRQRRLVFRDDTLEDIASEFNRYNKSPRILIKGDDLRLKRFGGTFNADDPDSISQVLADNKTLTIERRGGEIIVRPR